MIRLVKQNCTLVNFVTNNTQDKNNIEIAGNLHQVLSHFEYPDKNLSKYLSTGVFLCKKGRLTIIQIK